MVMSEAAVAGDGFGFAIHWGRIGRAAVSRVAGQTERGTGVHFAAAGSGGDRRSLPAPRTQLGPLADRGLVGFSCRAQCVSFDGTDGGSCSVARDRGVLPLQRPVGGLLPSSICSLRL